VQSESQRGSIAGWSIATSRHRKPLSDLTHILGQIERGDESATERLLPLVYDELRQLAAAKMAREGSGQKHDATSLVHEAYLRLVGGAEGQNWDCRGHFFAAAAEAMRRILVDNARRRRRPKHGGDRKQIDLERCCALTPVATDDVLAVDEALTLLSAQDPSKAQLVKLRYFGGLTLEESAAVLGISLSTAKRHWIYSRAWLYSALTDG
jgi:RNA polymerase sigma factor (TIGR02999 family)